ncbi:glycoside hydrolase family 15 protein [Piptocephalis cylindrospora]|uniref:Glycoside hydrolase family 15 protein n=1 Tax=Piptocephalis cylindrospora TaxID=1907219 RepID=A0A4P9Y0Q9_9FUNG|nr:glycoside hydrolase family 15 protein [Piptocephalis cylindrospora]|eukprot:RKP11360.1 glycoside hydrolase family 15 protein [Piptocephalis cylindrospora]
MARASTPSNRAKSRSVPPDQGQGVAARGTDGYLHIEDYGLIGNLRTAALCGADGSIDHLCMPEFDSPSVFARILDRNKGGHFSVTPSVSCTTKQQYLPNTNVLQTRFLHDEGVCEVTDYMPRIRKDELLSNIPFLPWVVRHVSIVRGSLPIDIECFPAFNYAQDRHIATFASDTQHDSSFSNLSGTLAQDHSSVYIPKERILFESGEHHYDLRWIVHGGEHEIPKAKWNMEERPGTTGPGATLNLRLKEGQRLILIFRIPPTDQRIREDLQCMGNNPPLSWNLMHVLQRSTCDYWVRWISRSTYKGRWRENVLRSALVLKLMTYEPTGAVVASPTFSLPEAFGGGRNWDYRYTWVRDSSFTIYALIRLGFTDEAHAYMKFIEERCRDAAEDGSLQIMYGIRGEKRLEERELPHLEGHRGSRPVRIGNGAYDHLQLDIYGELMDGVYLYNKFGIPISYDFWVALRRMVNFVCDNWYRPDMSIWEVRSKMQNFVYSKVMCWVAVDRGLRLAEKRMFPCPDREKWLRVRDTIYEEIMEKGFNKEAGVFIQSYESQDTIDSAILIMPLVFFISPGDPRILKTIERILLPPEKGGLTVNNLVHRYNHIASDDGVGGEEGSFSMCTFWLVEALTRAGKYDRSLLERAVVIFEQMLGYGNHLTLFSEEVARSGEMLGNFPQAFTHIALISTAFNLDRTLK